MFLQTEFLDKLNGLIFSLFSWRAGLAVNGGLIADLPFVLSGPVAVSAWKPADDGGWILRFWECAGRDGEYGLGFYRPVFKSGDRRVV